MPSTSSLLKINFLCTFWGKGRILPEDTSIHEVQIYFLLKPKVAIAIPVKGSVILKWLMLKSYFAISSKFFLLIFLLETVVLGGRRMAFGYPILSLTPRCCLSAPAIVAM